VNKSPAVARASLGVAGKARGRTKSGSPAALNDQILGVPATPPTASRGVRSRPGVYSQALRQSPGISKGMTPILLVVLFHQAGESGGRKLWGIDRLSDIDSMADGAGRPDPPLHGDGACRNVHASPRLNLETAVGRVRECGSRAVRQGATTRRAAPCQEEQRRQAAREPCSRARSGLTHPAGSKHKALLGACPRMQSLKKPPQHIVLIN
jgi:hypothetical protein